MEQRPEPGGASGVRRTAARLLPGIRDLVAERDALRADRDRLRAERDGLRHKLEKADAERKELAKRVRKLEPREDLGYLFVLTYGRSGSTLLQGILNSIPGYLVRGENRQILFHLHEFHRTGVAERREQRRQQRKHGR